MQQLQQCVVDPRNIISGKQYRHVAQMATGAKTCHCGTTNRRLILCLSRAMPEKKSSVSSGRQRENFSNSLVIVPCVTCVKPNNILSG